MGLRAEVTNGDKDQTGGAGGQNKTWVRERKGTREKVQPEQKCIGAKEREGERHQEKQRTRTVGVGLGRNVLMQRFLSELPKLIISSGLAEPCQEQEPAAKPRPG